MAFEGLSSRLQEVTRKLRGKARITESDLKEMLREVKLALLEADVNYKIVKEFNTRIQEKALGQDVLKSLTPGQQVIKIVKDELVDLLGGTESKINFSPNPPTVIMLIGLQGSGKTTTAGKLANLLRKQGKKPLLVACDVYRPAAIKQLQVVGGQLNIPVYANENSKDVVHIAKQAMSIAMSKMNDVIILDTAGRLHIDEALMEELKKLKAIITSIHGLNEMSEKLSFIRKNDIYVPVYFVPPKRKKSEIYIPKKNDNTDVRKKYPHYVVASNVHTYYKLTNLKHLND